MIPPASLAAASLLLSGSPGTRTGRSGSAGLIIGLLALGLRCVVVSAETDPELRACAARVLPGIVHVQDVADRSAVG